jgi:hypothetical protein
LTVTTRRIGVIVLLALCVVCAGTAGGAGARLADNTLQVIYVGSSSLQLRLGDGTVVSPGGTVPAGSYQILVDDADYTTPQFTMSGPGVSISSNLNSTGMGIDRPATFGPYALQTNATYRLQDTSMGASFTFQTSSTASGGSTGSSGSSGASGGTSSTGSAGQSSGAAKSGAGAGAAATKLLGTLRASVAASGKATLTFGGKAVTKLRRGRYSVAVVDHSKKAGFVVGGPTRKITLSGVAAVGSSSHTVTLGAGKWFFEAAGNRKVPFVVSG